MDGKGIEIWKPVAGYEGLYEVSNQGNVRSVDRYVSNNWKNGLRLIKGKVLNYGCTLGGYKQVHLSKNGSQEPLYVHRLVAEAFLQNPDCLPEINHKDEDKTNNRVENLEWCDRKYNANYGTAIERASEKHGRKIECLSVDWTERKTFNSFQSVEDFLGFKCKNSIYAHIENHYPFRGYYWKFRT